MTHFHGDLLLGGARLRELDGEIVEHPAGHEENWSGEFSLSEDQLDQLEIGRPYLLILDDGRGGRVEVTEVCPLEDQGDCLVRFSASKHPR